MVRRGIVTSMRSLIKWLYRWHVIENVALVKLLRYNVKIFHEDVIKKRSKDKEMLSILMISDISQSTHESFYQCTLNIKLHPFMFPSFTSV